MSLSIKLCTHAKLNCLKELLICIKMDFALNNLQRLICHKTQLTNIYANKRLISNRHGRRVFLISHD